MPIQFRCGNCNQLLGIASRKAGAVVNCPTCGGKTIVPRPRAAPGKHRGDFSLLERVDVDKLLGNPVPGRAATPPAGNKDHDRASNGSAPREALGRQADPAELRALPASRLSEAPATSIAAVDEDDDEPLALEETAVRIVLALTPVRLGMALSAIALLVAAAFCLGWWIGSAG